MRSPAQLYRDGLGLIRDYLGEPTSPYTSADPKFRKKFKESAPLPLVHQVRGNLEKRYGLRANSVANTVIILSVVLTSSFVFFDTVADTLTTIDSWARPMFVPALWAVMAMVYFLIQAVKSPKDEVHPDLEYSGDEIKQAIVAALGEAGLQKYISDQPSEAAASTEHSIAVAQTYEVAGRASHDRGTLRTRRYYKNKALSAAIVALGLFGLALTIFAFVSPFV